MNGGLCVMNWDDNQYCKIKKINKNLYVYFNIPVVATEVEVSGSEPLLQPFGALQSAC